MPIAGRAVPVTQDGAAGTFDQRFVQRTYFGTLGRVPDPAEVDVHVVQGFGAGVSREQLVANFFNSEEFNLGSRFIAGLYVGLLARDAEYTGWLFQRNALITGQVSHRDLVRNFLMSAEYELRFPAQSASDFVRHLYRNVLLREASQAEVDFHVGSLQTGGLTRVDVAVNFLNAPEFRAGIGPRLTAFLLYAAILQRDSTPGERSSWAEVIGRGAPFADVIATFVNSGEVSGQLR
jgi:hypothetical protein